MSLQFNLKSTLSSHSGDIFCLTRYNNLLVSGSDDETIKLWNEKDKCISTFNANRSVSCLTIFNDMIISGESGGVIEYWNSSTGKCIKSIKGHNNNGLYIFSLIVINNLLYSGSDGSIMVWTEDGECIHTIKAHSMFVSCLIEYEGMLISGGWDSTIRCWSLSSYDCIKTLEGHYNSIRCFAVYDKYLLSGSFNTTMKLWDVTEESCIRTFEHEGAVMSILVVDRFIINSDNNGKIYIWSIEGNLLESVQAHSYSINSLVIHQNYIYSSSCGGFKEEKTIKKWSFSHL